MNKCVWLLCGLLTASAFAQQNLVVNGGFDSPEGALKGWNTDYAWTDNSFYVGNASRIKAVDQFSGQRQVVKLLMNGEAGSKIESVLIPYEQGAKYRAKLKVQGGSYRIYFSGYSWKSGIRPHDAPTLPEMKPAYRSKATTGQSSGWQTITLDIPGTEASELSLKHLNKVRFLTLYIWFLKDGHVDDVSVTKVN